jgi:hypothetical protein
MTGWKPVLRKNCSLHGSPILRHSRHFSLRVSNKMTWSAAILAAEQAGETPALLFR